MKKKMADYTNKLADKYNIPEPHIRRLLKWMLFNMTDMMMRGEDIRIPRFGNIYTDKKKAIEDDRRHKERIEALRRDS